MTTSPSLGKYLIFTYEALFMAVATARMELHRLNQEDKSWRCNGVKRREGNSINESKLCYKMAVFWVIAPCRLL
jgi:hypothetical protein